MPRSYGRTATSIWRDKDFLKRSPEARFIFMMLFNQDNVSAAGMLELTVTRWARYTGYSVPTVAAALEELEQHDYIVVDSDTEELFVRTFVKWDGGLGNDLRRRAIVNAAGTVASDRIRAAMARQLDRVDVPHSLHPETVPTPDQPVDNRPRNGVSIPAGNEDRNSVSNGSRDAIETRRVVVKEGDYLLEPQPPTLRGEPEPLTATADASAPPAMFCTKHPQGTEDPCGPCADARKRYAAHVADTVQAATYAKRLALERRRACPDCDDAGMRVHPDTKLPLGRCDHPNRTEPSS